MPRRKDGRCLAAALLAAACLAGCAPSNRLYKVHPDPDLKGVPAIAKAAAHAGVYYSPRFTEQEHTRKFLNGTWVVSIGAASSKVFDQLLSRAFERTSRLSSLTNAEIEASGVDVVVVPTLEHFDFHLGMVEDSERYSVVYRTTLYSRRGVPVASWVVSGNAPTRAMRSLKGVIEDDISAAAVRFAEGFGQYLGPSVSAVTATHEDAAAASELPVVVSARRTNVPGLDHSEEAVLDAAGVVAVRVAVRSEADRDVVVRGSDMRLRTSGGQVLEPIPLSAALSLLERTSDTGPKVAFFLGALAGTFAALSEERSNQARHGGQFKAGSTELFGEQTLRKGKEAAGIVLFRTQGSAWNEAATLAVWAVHPAAARGVRTEVSFTLAPGRHLADERSP